MDESWSHIRLVSQHTTHRSCTQHTTHIVLHNTQCTAQVSHQTSLTTHNTGLPYTTQNTQVSHTQHTTHRSHIHNTSDNTDSSRTFNDKTDKTEKRLKQKTLLLGQTKWVKNWVKKTTSGPNSYIVQVDNNAFWAQNENLELVERRGNNHPLKEIARRIQCLTCLKGRSQLLQRGVLS